jgi:hypothetical protein
MDGECGNESHTPNPYTMTTVYVSGCNPAVDAASLQTVLGVVGTIENIERSGDHYVVTYETAEMAQIALQLTGTTIVDRPIKITSTAPLDQRCAQTHSFFFFLLWLRLSLSLKQKCHVHRSAAAPAPAAAVAVAAAPGRIRIDRSFRCISIG